MKILHTGDWHLGKRLDRFERWDEQKAVTDEICEIAEREDVDLILIAGDLYDTFNPPIEATELFYKQLKRLSKNGLRPVVAIAGNHDSADRIEAPDPLARECGIILVGYPYSVVPKFKLDTGLEVTHSEPGFIELKLPKRKSAPASPPPSTTSSEKGQTNLFAPAPPSATPTNNRTVRLLLTPYANEARLKKNLNIEDSEAELRQLLQDHWAALADAHCDEQGVNLLMAHLFVVRENGPRPEEPEDEKPILHVGGAQEIYTHNFPKQVQYVALGHLHRCHEVHNDPCPIVYSGSPLAYSFAEAGQSKYVMLLDAEPGQPVQPRKVALTAGKPLLRETFEDVDEALHWLEAHPHAIVELSLKTDSYIRAEDRKLLNQSHKNLIGPIPVLPEEGEEATHNTPSISISENIETLFMRYFEHKKKEPPNEALMDLFREVIGKEETR